GLLALPTLNLALSNLKTEAAEAVLGDLDGKSLALLVEKAGKQAVFFDWTLRGAPGPAGLQFELQLPPAPVTSLELTLPADHLVTVPRSVGLLSGPHEAEDAGQRVWRLSCAGRAQVALLIRRPTSQEGGLPAPPLLLARQDVRQVLAPERLL